MLYALAFVSIENNDSAIHNFYKFSGEKFIKIDCLCLYPKIMPWYKRNKVISCTKERKKHIDTKRSLNIMKKHLIAKFRVWNDEKFI